MRAGSFSVEGADGQKADVSIIALGGGAGGLAPNVNRWRGQIELPPASEDEILQALVEVELAGQKAKLADLRNEKSLAEAGNRIIAAILPRGEQTWFFKMQGPDALVGKQKESFAAFLKTVTFGAAATAELPPSHPPISADAVAAAPAAAVAAAAAEIPGGAKWQVPAGWQPQPPKPMLLAGFAIPSGADKADVTVSSLGGTAGGLLANVSRWRGQLGLGPASEADLAKWSSPIEVNGERGTVVDMTNDATGKRLVAVVLPHAGSTWFFKLTGSSTLLEKEKAAFLQFAQSIRFPKNE